MQVKNLIKALTILEQYTPEGKNHYLAAEHDVIYMGDTDWDIPEEVLQQLDELGVHPDEDLNCFYAFT